MHKTFVMLFISVSALLASCAKEYSCEGCNQSPPPAPPVPSPSPVEEPAEPLEFLYAAVEMDGLPTLIENRKNNVTTTYNGWINGPSFCMDYYWLTSLTAPQEKPYFGFLMGAKSVGSYEEAKSYFAPGEYSFLTLLPDPIACCPCRALTDGVAINFRDTAGVWWASYFGSADQTGSVFTIEEQVEDEPVLYVRAIFNCKMYTEQGTVKWMYGQFRLRVW